MRNIFEELMQGMEAIKSTIASDAYHGGMKKKKKKKKKSKRSY